MQYHIQGDNMTFEEEEEGEKCPDCGAIMRYVIISTDADGNRPEYGYECPNCD